ncbi:MAG: DUF1566 domain-containing protein, partial [Bacteroidales bacterium]|nr:DUF1566 domain-containing protein [Bacteroidales bacterium]
SYSFDDVKAGEYLLRVEVPGYKRTEYRVVVESGRSARADMQVKPRGEGDEDEYDEGDVYVIKAENLMVQKEDLGAEDWVTADATCKASRLGGYTDWRLPTKEELMLLYANRNLIGGFQNAWWYWSSTEYGESHCSVNFSNGEWAAYAKICRIRAVRTIKTEPEEPEEPEDPYVTLPVVNLMVQKEDLGLGYWTTADAMCKASTLADYTDWRLPTKEELMILYTNRNLIGGFQKANYWSSTRYSESSYYYWYVNFSDGAMNTYNGSCRIRAVRYINPPTPEEPEMSYVTIPELNLMVQTADMSGEFTWGQARVVCTQSTVGGYTDWRLPTGEELVGLCERKFEIGGFEQGEKGIYWAETIRDDGNSEFHQLVNFSEGEDCFNGWARNDYLYRVRAVRTISE